MGACGISAETKGCAAWSLIRASKPEPQRAAAQQPFQSSPVVPGDAPGGVRRKLYIIPHEHVAGAIGVEQAAAGEPAQHPATHRLADCSNMRWRQVRGLEKSDLAVVKGARTRRRVWSNSSGGGG